MNDKIVSVVVPAYNAGRFLDKGMPTFLEPDILSKIEILIIDDGSKDNTAQIAGKYEECYPMTVRYVYKENGGHGSAVNEGIKEASGRYFMVVDADDWVHTKMFTELVLKLECIDVDLVLTHAAVVDASGKITGYERIKGLSSNRILGAEQALTKLSNIEMHNYCIKTDILKRNNIRCHEHHFYVDNEFVLYPLVYVKTVIYYDLAVYQYLVGREGQSVSIEKRRENLIQYLEVADFLKAHYYRNKEGMSWERKVFFERKIAYFISGVYSVFMSYQSDEKKWELMEFDKYLKSDKELYAANRNLCIRILRCSNFKLYGFCSWIYRTVNGIKG